MYRCSLFPGSVLTFLIVIASVSPAVADFPVHRWSRIITRDSPMLSNFRLSMAIDGAGNVVVGGIILKMWPHNAYWHAFWKYGPEGQLIWTREYPGASSASYPEVAFDPAGNVIIAGSFVGTTDFGGGPLSSDGNYLDIFLLKLDASGNHVWSRRFGGTYADQALGVGVTSQGHIVVGGTHWGVDFGGGVLPASQWGINYYRAEFDGNGVHTASHSFQFPGASGAIERDMAINGDGVLYVTGEFSVIDNSSVHLVTVGGSDIFLLAFGADGSVPMAKRFGGSGNDVGHGVAIASNGDILLTGSIYGQVGFGGQSLNHCASSYFVARFSSNGLHRWSQTDRSICGASSTGIGIAAGPSGRTVVTGYFSGSGNIDFGTGPMQSFGDRDIFVVSYDAPGTPEWAGRYGIAGRDQGSAVALDAAGESVVAGRFAGTLITCTGPLGNSNSQPEWFLFKTGAGANPDHTPPSVPTNLTYDGHMLQWAPSTDPEGSPVWYQLVDIDNFPGLHTWEVHDANTSYETYLSVYAFDCVGNRSAVSARVEVVAAWAAPQAPTGLKYDGKTLSWDPAIEPDALHYVVHGSPTGVWDDGLRTRLGLVTATSLDVSNSGAAYFFVTTVDQYLNWGDHALLKDNVAPSSPTGFYRAANRLNWDAPTDPGFDHFSLYGSVSADFSSPVLIATTRKYGIYLEVNARYAYYRLTLTDAAGNASAPAQIPGYVSFLSSVEIPRYSLSLNAWPNPTRGNSTVAFTLPSEGRAVLKIYDARGAQVASLVDDARRVGEYRETWDGRTVSGAPAATGIYFARLEFKGEMKTHKIVLIR